MDSAFIHKQAHDISYHWFLMFLFCPNVWHKISNIWNDFITYMKFGQHLPFSLVVVCDARYWSKHTIMKRVIFTIDKLSNEQFAVKFNSAWSSKYDFRTIQICVANKPIFFGQFLRSVKSHTTKVACFPLMHLMMHVVPLGDGNRLPADTAWTQRLMPWWIWVPHSG